MSENVGDDKDALDETLQKEEVPDDQLVCARLQVRSARQFRKAGPQDRSKQREQGRPRSNPAMASSGGAAAGDTRSAGGGNGARARLVCIWTGHKARCVKS